MKIKHIYWFAYFNADAPSVRYRAKYPLQQLKENNGINFSIVYPGYDHKNLFNFILVYFSALLFRKKHSVIVFQKIYTKGIYATALKVLLFFRGNNTLYDIDDAEYTRHPRQTIHYFMKNCSCCSAGSISLMEYIKNFNSNVFFLTSPVIDHGLSKSKLEKTFTVGWLGFYGAHRENLMELFFPALSTINFPLKLKLLGVANETEANEIKSYFLPNPNIIVETPISLNWQNEASIYQTITSFDIEISPLKDTEFNRGKSAFKLKQCLSCGVPVLGNSVGENNRFLINDVNGYICEKPDDYLEKLLNIRNAQNGLYKNLSANAKSTFPMFSMDNYCATFTGCDFSEKMVEEATKQNQKLIKTGQAKFYLANAENLPFENEVFNKVFSVNTLYFWENPALILSEIWRVLQPA